MTRLGIRGRVWERWLAKFERNWLRLRGGNAVGEGEKWWKTEIEVRLEIEIEVTRNPN